MNFDANPTFLELSWSSCANSLDSVQLEAKRGYFRLPDAHQSYLMHFKAVELLPCTYFTKRSLRRQGTAAVGVHGSGRA